MCHVCATVVPLLQCDQLLLAFGYASPFLRHEYFCLRNICVSSLSLSLLTFLPSSVLLLYDPHTHFMFNVNTKNIKDVFRASRFP